MAKFAIGEKVDNAADDHEVGTVIAVFPTIDGSFRYAVDTEGYGALQFFTEEKLARISHGFKRIGAPNQRKLFCENDFLVIRGEPRCKQSVSRICLDLKPSKAAQ